VPLLECDQQHYNFRRGAAIRKILTNVSDAQVHYEGAGFYRRGILVGDEGIEPPTSRM
jgi:hypothetical protein